MNTTDSRAARRLAAAVRNLTLRGCASPLPDWLKAVEAGDGAGALLPRSQRLRGCRARARHRAAGARDERGHSPVPSLRRRGRDPAWVHGRYLAESGVPGVLAVTGDRLNMCLSRRASRSMPLPDRLDLGDRVELGRGGRDPAPGRGLVPHLGARRHDRVDRGQRDRGRRRRRWPQALQGATRSSRAATRPAPTADSGKPAQGAPRRARLPSPSRQAQARRATRCARCARPRRPALRRGQGSGDRRRGDLSAVAEAYAEAGRLAGRGRPSRRRRAAGRARASAHGASSPSAATSPSVTPSAVHASRSCSTSAASSSFALAPLGALRRPRLRAADGGRRGHSLGPVVGRGALRRDREWGWSLRPGPLRGLPDRHRGIAAPGLHRAHPRHRRAAPALRHPLDRGHRRGPRPALTRRLRGLPPGSGIRPRRRETPRGSPRWADRRRPSVVGPARPGPDRTEQRG